VPVRIADVAAAAGVSTATVSRVLNNNPRVGPALRRRVDEAISRLGYRPNTVARALRTGRTPTIAVLEPEEARLHNPYYVEMLLCLTACARAHGLQVVVALPGQWPAGAFAEMLSWARTGGLGGLILMDGVHGAPYAAEHEPSDPVAIVLGGIDDFTLPYVGIDEEEGGQKATRHLISLGHEVIGHLSGPDVVPMPHSREAGYARAMTDAGLEPIIQLSVSDPLCAREATHQLLDRFPEVTAIVAHNDFTAFGAMRAVAERGLRVPADVSVVGFDDVSLAAYASPPLTTVAYRISDIAFAAVDLMVRLLGGEPAPHVPLFSGLLVVRSSTARRR